MHEALRQADLDHVELYVADVEHRARDLVDQYGFDLAGWSEPGVSSHRSVALRQGGILLVLTQGLSPDHPATVYVLTHGDGTASIALRTADVPAAVEAATAAGARRLATTAFGGQDGPAITAFGDVRHTFIQRRPDEPRAALPPGFVAASTPSGAEPARLRQIDHIAVCVEPGELEPTIGYYVSALGFEQIFEEHIVIGEQGMNSQVVRNAAGGVTLTVLEPDTDRSPGQIDDFIKNHGGAGVQHLAFSTPDIVQAVDSLKERGVDFLRTPDMYYDLLAGRLDLAAHSVSELRSLGVLADSDHAGQLFQIFTRSVHPRRTFFLEVIERLGAESFGSGNIKALYEAVELEQELAAGQR